MTAVIFIVNYDIKTIIIITIVHCVRMNSVWRSDLWHMAGTEEMACSLTLGTEELDIWYVTRC